MTQEPASNGRMSADAIRQMDESVWLSHADPWKPLDMMGFSREQWKEYADLTRAAARGYWHGESGVLAGRLKISKRQWLKASRAWHPKGWVPDKIGDTCFGVFAAIVSRAVKGDEEPTGGSTEFGEYARRHYRNVFRSQAVELRVRRLNKEIRNERTN